jgi:ankyrin repeat protein
MKKRATKRRPSIIKCVETGDVETLRALVANGVGLLDEMEDTSPLAMAVEKRNPQMVLALLDLGHNPNLGGIVVPLAEAAQNGDSQIIDLLLARGANINESGEEGETALMWAAGAGHLSIVRRLLDAGSDAKQQDREGQDALDYAVNGRRTEVIEFLLSRYPKSRQDKIQRQAHIWRVGKERESLLAARLQEAMARPQPKGKKRTQESLIRAYETGNHKQLLQLLAAGADPNETNKEGTTILVMVAREPELVKALLKAGADPNRGELFRPLDIAASHGVVESVRLLLEAGANANWADANGGTALMSAAAADDEDTVRLLLDAGANPNVEDCKGHTAYWAALECNNHAVADLLAPLTADADDARMPWRKNKEGKSRELCLIDAANGRDLEHVRHLLAEGLRVDAANESGDTPLHCAANNGDVEMIRVLLAAGAPIEAEGCADHTALVAAANSGQTNAVRVLLEAGANVHANDDEILCYACEKEDSLELVELLLKAEAKVNVVGGWRGSSPLHVATEHDQLALVRRLLDAGANVRAKDSNGWTPFLNAALRSGVETVQLLIKAGSDIKAVDRERRNAYDLASKWGKREVAEFLKPLVGVA